jgi:NTE family protein
VLGGGGARGLAHIPVLEALDEVGVRPAVIAGSSIGAGLGAAYGAGMTGKEIRRHALTLMHDRGDVLRRLMNARSAGLGELFSSALGNPLVMSADKLTDAFLPARVPATFEELEVPLIVMTADLYARTPAAFSSGPVRPPLAASMAIPGLIRPVQIDGRVLVDGAAIDPLPFECLRGRADVILAVDTSVGPREPQGVPNPWDALFSTIQLMSHALVAEKLRRGAPDIVVRPNVGTFRLLDFFHASAILRAADAVKPEVKARLAEMLAA